MADSLALVPVFTGTLQAQSTQLCDARTLHAFMAVLRDFATWIKGRIRKFGFIEGLDFIAIARSPDLGSGNRGAAIDYHLTLDMAKELAMVENNDKGREARRYFIACEKQTLEILTEPSQMALDYTRINPAQAQTLKELVQTVVDSGAQGYGETWARLHKKFRVNSYLELSAEQFEQACDYLRAKAPQAPVLDADRIKLAFSLSAEVASQASRTVFDAVMAGSDEWKRDRWMFCLGYGKDNQPSVPWAKAIDREAVVMSLEGLAVGIAEPGNMLPTNTELANLAAACNKRLAERMTYQASKSTAVTNLTRSNP